MKSIVLALVIVVLGSLSFSLDGSTPEFWEYPISSDLDSQGAFHRLSSYVEDHYPYSVREYHWEGQRRIISVEQGVGAYAIGDEGQIKYCYRLTISIEDNLITLVYSDFRPYPNSMGMVNLNRKGDWDSIQQDFQDLNQEIEGLLQ